MRRRVVVACAAATVTAAEIGVTLGFGPGAGWSLLAPAAGLVAVGTLLGVRRPRNPIGWLLLAWSVICGYGGMVGAWGAHAVATHHIGTVLPWAAEFVTIVWHPGFCLFVMVCLVFPDGRFMSPRWRRLAVVITAWYVALAVASVLAPDQTALYVPHVRQPYVSPVQSVADGAFGVLLSFQLGWLVVGAGALVVRWRRTSGDERRQVAVFVFPTALALLLFVLGVVVTGSGAWGFFVFPVLPISIGVAVLRYKLYAIDQIVSRTVSYAIVTAVVVGVYVGAVQLVDLAVPRNSVAVAGATLAAAAVFSPVRHRVQRLVDRRFNRAQYDRDRLVGEFRAALRRPDVIDDTEAELVDVVAATLQPAACWVWLAPGNNA